MNYVTAHYSEIVGGGYRKVAAASGGTTQPQVSGIQLWQKLSQAIEKARELRYDSYTGYDVYLCCHRDEASKNEVEAIYKSLPPEVKQIYNKDGFIELCQMKDEDRKYERTRFVKKF